MKVLFILSVVIFGVICVQSLNEDEMRDEVNYVSKRRSKRALCGQQAKATQRPIVRPSYCKNCICRKISPIVLSKRAATSSKVGGIIGLGCRDYYACCRNPILKSSSSAGKAAVNVKGMASNLLKLFGKRAAEDDKFKKPSVDLIFLIDDSGSIPAAQFTIAKEGAATLSQAVCPQKFGSTRGSKQVSAVLFSTTAKTVLTYQESQKGAGFVENAILNMKQRSGSTATASALKYVREKVLTQPGNRLNDPDTATIVFVITDGKCNNGCHQLIAEAEKLRGSGPGVQVFSFGVGEADCQELEEIRGKDTGVVFGLPDYNFFEKLANSVKEQMAKNGDKLCIK